MDLPAEISVADFDALHDAPERWRGLITELAATHGLGPVQQPAESTALVALGATAVIKLYPPFLRDHHAFECGLLPRLHGRLSLPTPQLIAQGEHQGWPWLVISRLPGRTLTGVWPTLDEGQRCRLLHRLGALAAQVHALPVGEQAALAPAWPEFLARQRAGCRRRPPLPTGQRRATTTAKSMWSTMRPSSEICTAWRSRKAGEAFRYTARMASRWPSSMARLSDQTSTSSTLT